MLYTEVMNDNKQFQRCYHRGQCVVSRHVILYALRNKEGFNRLGITTGKKVGNAVCRSRARRIIRAAWRENEMDAPVGLDIVIVARSSITGIGASELGRYLQRTGIPALHSICRGEKPGGRQNP